MQSDGNGINNKMNKPIKIAKFAYDYIEVSKYLQDKYGYDERDYSGYWKIHHKVWNEVLKSHGIIGDSLNGLPDDEIQEIHEEIEAKCPPRQDFWHFVIDKEHVSNGSYFDMSEWWFESAEDWQREIGMRYLDEFGEGEVGDRSIEFYVEW